MPGGANRGTDGPIEVRMPELHPTTERFLEAGRDLQLPYLEDYNGAPCEGLTAVQQTRRGT